MIQLHVDRTGRILVKAEQLSLFGGAGPRKPVEKPGSRGGKYYVTDTGRVEYGTKPTPTAPKSRVDTAQAVGHSGGMKTIEVLAIVRAGTAEVITRVPKVTVRKDGTLWAGKNTLPLTNSSGSLGKDALVPLVRSGKWDKIPADNFLRLGHNRGDKECITEAELHQREASSRPEAEKAYDAVLRAEAALDAAEAARYYSPERIIAARRAVKEAEAAWAKKYPEAARARAAGIERAAADHEAEIRSSAGYQAALEGRD